MLLLFVFFTGGVLGCPKDTLLLKSNGRKKECTPGKPGSCPRNYVCLLHIPENRYYCCGKHFEFCRSGEVAMREDRTPLTCQTDECPSPFACERSTKDGNTESFCCRPVFEMEPPPIGCPWGTRPLKGQNHQRLRCTPGSAHVCPGNSICYHDSLTKSYSCCGKDPGEGCPSGTRPVRQNGQHVPCIPGDSEQECPGFSICQWNYMTDYYQCCAPDNGCPEGAAPAFVNENIAQMCNKDDKQSCPAHHTCEFNFWISSYQCCGPDIELCPPGRIPYFERGTVKTRLCPQNAPHNFCPIGYACEVSKNSNSQRALCCGTAGQCPDNSSPELDELSNVKACSPYVSGSNICSPGSSCLAALGGSSDHHLCCRNSDAHCPMGFTSETPHAVAKCDPGRAYSICKLGSQCLQSMVDSRLFLCCAQIQSQCPPGYSPPGNGATTECINSNDCPMSSICLPSVSRSNSKICCQPASGEITTAVDHCGRYGKLQNNQLIMCGGAAANAACQIGSFCVFSMRNPTLRLCCVFDVFALHCPPGYSTPIDAVNGRLQQCDYVPCPLGSVCMLAVAGTDSPQVKLCCSVFDKSSNAECPEGYALPSRGVVQYCSNYETPCAYPGARCLDSPRNPGSRICCVVRNENLACPNNGVIYSTMDKVPYECRPGEPRTCPTGYQCQNALNSRSFVCCRQLSEERSYICPENKLPATNSLGRIILCSFGDQNVCPRDFSCAESLNDRTTFICCPSPALCPDGQLPVAQPSGLSDESTCKSCPIGSRCQRSRNQLNVYVCCLDESLVVKCPVDYRPMELSQTAQCSPFNCPPPNVCMLRSYLDDRVKICCRPLQPGQRPCSYGTSAPLLQNGAYYTRCQAPGAACSVRGFFCQFSPVLSTNICCSNQQRQMLDGENEKISENVLLKWKCISGRNPFPNAIAPLPCNPLASRCPKGSSCELSSTTQENFICCDIDLRPYARPQCPAFWERQSYLSPYMKCSGADDHETCSPGFSCLPADVANVHICCQLKDTAYCSSNGRKPLLKNRGQPWHCKNSVQCPPGFSCQISKDFSSKFCCEEYPSSSNNFDSVIPCNNPLKVNGRIFYCDLPDSCPENFYCAKPAAVCCPRLKDDPNQSQICDSGQLPFLIEGRAVECNFDQHRCRKGYHCQQNSHRKDRYHCCQKPDCPEESFDALFPARTLFLTNGRPKYCNPSFSFSCPTGSICRESVNMPGNFICCAQDLGRLTAINRCIGRMTHLSFGYPIDCSSGKSYLCPKGTECSDFTTIGKSICCVIDAKIPMISPLCPSGEPYLNPMTKNFHYCSSTDFTCPFGYVCRKAAASSVSTGKSAPSDLYVCCSNPKTCQVGWRPLISDDYEVRSSHHKSSISIVDCSPSTSDSCPVPYKCQQSTVPGEFICCADF